MNLRRLAKDEQGSLMLEFIICMPAYMILLFGCVQFAHLWMGRQVVHYAAYCAARSALVSVADPGGERPNMSTLEPGSFLELSSASTDDIIDHVLDSESDIRGLASAIRVTQWLGIGDESTREGTNAHLPGWGNVLASNDAAERTRCATDFNDWNVGATVTYDFPLITPLVGPFIAAITDNDPDNDDIGFGMGLVGRTEGIRVINGPQSNATYKKTNVDGFPRMTLHQTVWLPKPFRSVMERGQERTHHHHHH